MEPTHPSVDPLLLDEEQVLQALNIERDDLEWLVATEQLLPIYLHGLRRFSRCAVTQLVEVYRHVQNRS